MHVTRPFFKSSSSPAKLYVEKGVKSNVYSDARFCSTTLT